MNWRERWARLSGRERTLIGAAGAVFALALVRFLIISPFLGYRESLQDEIASHRDMLQNDHAYLARATDITRHVEALRTRYREVSGQLVPGNTPTLAAASLQDTLHSLAVEKGISVQSTQVMREETVGDFRRIAVRITVTGELRQLAEFLAGIEFGQRRLGVPFLEISRRGAVLRGQSARALAATIEVNAFLQGTEKGDAKVEEAAAPAGGEPPAVDAGVATAAPGEPPAPGAPPVPGAPPGPGVPPAAAASPAPSGPTSARAVAERVVRGAPSAPRAGLDTSTSAARGGAS
jgi:type II secretory pathway component PulM